MSEPTLIRYFMSIQEQLSKLGMKVEVTLNGFVVFRGDDRMFVSKTVEGLAGFAEGCRKCGELCQSKNSSEN